MKTSTTVISAATLTVAAEDEFSGAVGVDLNALTPTNNDIVLRVVLTNGSTIQTGDRILNLSYAFNSTDAHTTASTLKSSAKKLVLIIPSGASEVLIHHTDKVTLQNRWIHVWYQHAPFSGTVTLDVQAIS